MKTIKMLHKVASQTLVDVSGGIGAIEEWASDIRWRHHRKHPEVIVLVLERSGEKYKGALYLTRKDFGK
jgi:predicted Rossmann-fold nucleotide-binding protein